MSIKTIEFIKNVNNHFNGNVIILGGWSKYFNGYNPNYNKHWVDISITPDNVNLLSELGVVLEINGGHSWGNQIINQVTVMCGSRQDRKFLDVFIDDKISEYKIIDGLKILTPEASIKWHEEAYEVIGEDWVKHKIEKLKYLYGM